MLKPLMRSLAPPILWKAASRVKGRKIAESKSAAPAESLFGGDDSFMKELGPQCTVYGEYGVGTSTKWMIANTAAQVVAVDTSEEWLSAVSDGLPVGRAEFAWVNLGPLSKWGYPVNYERRDTFYRYPEALWQFAVKPDLVLIDGRFRVSCFLTTLTLAYPGTAVIFDDYVSRPDYHVVEEFCELSRRSTRQGLFIVPDSVDKAAARREAERFSMVMD